MVSQVMGPPWFSVTGWSASWGWVEILALWANQNAAKLWNTTVTSGTMVYMACSPQDHEGGCPVRQESSVHTSTCTLFQWTWQDLLG